MGQLLVLDSGSKKIKVYLDGKLIKIIEDVRIGLNGVCDYGHMVEGGKRTPIGLYNIGVGFGIHDLKTKYPYIKIDNDSYWVDDSKSKYYNCFVQFGNINDFGFDYIFRVNEKDFESAEHLIDYEKAYEYALFIEYNTDRIEDKGSAIFLHCHSGEYTYGCVAISMEDMKWLFSFIDRDKNPKILIK